MKPFGRRAGGVGRTYAAPQRAKPAAEVQFSEGRFHSRSEDARSQSPTAGKGRNGVTLVRHSVAHIRSLFATHCKCVIRAKLGRTRGKHRENYDPGFHSERDRTAG